MSLFKSELPTEANAFIEALAKNKTATFHGVSLTPEHHIVVLWEDANLYTGLTVPVDYPANMVKAGKLPAKVCKASEKPKVVQTPPANQSAPQANVAQKTAIPVYLDEDGLREAVAKGQAVEYQGVLPKWLPFNPKKDKYIEGYYFRVKAKAVDKQPALA